MQMPAYNDDVSAILHDLNNDLGVIVGHLDLAIRKGQELPDSLLKRLQSIKRTSTRMADNIKRAQASARSQRV